MLVKSGLHEEQISIQFSSKVYIWSNTANKAISENGFRTRLPYNSNVYNNIHTTEIAFQQWLSDFDAWVK